MTGNTTCLDCPAGSYAESMANTACSLCAGGSYGDDVERAYCTPCSPGRASAVAGLNTSCPFCPSGMEQPQYGRTACHQCAFGTDASLGSYCDRCGVHMYTPAVGSVYVTCDDDDQVGLICLDGLANVAPGWWAYQVNDTESGESIYRTTECPPDFCPGAALQTRNVSAAADPICIHPRSNWPNNWLCAECESGSIAWGSSCDTCTGVNAGTSILVSLFCFLLIGFFLRSGTSSTGHLSILLFYVQIAAILLSDLGSDSLWMD
jgi:hypothetical protein